MLQVEKSHVPFPDEPPVEFPPAAAWKALAELRKAKYESTSFGSDMPRARHRAAATARRKPVKYPGLDDPKTTLTKRSSRLAKRYNLSFDINEKAFKFENIMDVGKTEIADAQPDPGDAHHALDGAAQGS